MLASIGYLRPRTFTLFTASVSVPGLLGFGADLTSVIDPDTTEPAGMATRPASSVTSATTVAVNESPGFAVLELMVSVVAMVNCRPASSVRVARAAGALVPAEVSAACPVGLQATRVATLKAAPTLVQEFGFIVRLRCPAST